MNKKVVIVSVPWTDTQSPIMAPAVLKSILKSHGIDSVAFDLNAEFRNLITDDPLYNDILKFVLTEQVTTKSKHKIIELLDWMSDKILEYNPEWVAISLLTYLSQVTTKWLCFRLRQKNKKIKIVIGGPGASTSLKSVDSYADSLKRQGLIDNYIVGDAELSFPKLIKGENSYSGIDSNNWEQIPTLNNQPWPDYENYNWSLYKNKSVSIVGSRGCVRKCTFCDIHEHWEKYQWRTGEDIFKEILFQKERYNISIFKFSDSLVNGNQQEYFSLINLLSEYNSLKSKSEWIRWSGSFIIRPASQMKEEMWRLTALSGAQILDVGVESFVDHIRYHIKKKFSNDDVDFALEMARKYNIKLILLIIIGYITETEEDFKKQLQWVEQHKQFANNPVVNVHIGSGLSILKGTWLHRNYKDYNITLNENGIEHDWVREEIGSTPQRRMEWHRLMKAKLEECGFSANYIKDNHTLIEDYFIKKYN